MLPSKPVDVFDRDTEWADLTEFSGSDLPGLRIAVVYGRRRQGKSYLLRRLAEASGGLYHLATEQTEAVSVRRFAESLARWLNLAPDSLSFDGWEQALTGATALMTRHAASVGTDSPPLLVLDEFPYLVHETPALPSLIQALYDEIGPGSLSVRTPFRLVLCGSAISVMSSLLSGTKALRGRGALELRVKPFGFRDARAYWEIENVQAALVHNALIGGTPGYRELVPDPRVPEDPEAVGTWLARNVLRPTAPLFGEAGRLIHEDPRIRDTAVYESLMTAIAAGETSPTKIGGLLGRPSSSLTHQLAMLESAGFVERRQDLLLNRRPAITVADPVVRLHHLVVEPHLADLEAGRAQRVWERSRHTVESKILGPHFERLATEWVTERAWDEASLEVGATGHATVACREHRTSHEIDVLSLDSGTRPRTAGAGIALIAEAKARATPPGMDQLHRLEHLRALLTEAGHDTNHAVLGLFSTSGFTADLTTEARQRGNNLLLADLDRLYGTPRGTSAG